MFDTSQNAFVDLRNIIAERTDRIVLWIGAGLSISAGLPTWDQLITDLIEKCEKKATGIHAEDAHKIQQKIEVARNETDPWLSTEILHDALGQSSFRASIRKILQPAQSAAIPMIYSRLWDLRPGGILSLNLDRFASRTYPRDCGRGQLIEFQGFQVKKYMYALKAPQPFVANLHGVIEDFDSWVLRKSDLTTLCADDIYRLFVETILSSRTVVFLGITADDVAAGGHLERLTKRGIDFGEHFWITPRCDLNTDEWAEHSSIRVIRYCNPAKDHAELAEAITNLLSYVPHDDTPPPVTPTAGTIDVDLLPPDELVTMPAETIRIQLNANANKILSSNNPDKYTEYEQFCADYAEAIYRAWYVTTSPPSNLLFGNNIVGKLAKGAFGRVFRAKNDNEEDIAVKVLHQEVHGNGEMLECFRRGVQSMQILSKAEISGMVPYRAASEIPACVFMDFIEGLNLREAMDAKIIKGWPSILRIATDLSGIIRSAHVLPERVLHRDIRPANVMLKNTFSDSHEWAVMVLDFDLSWHRDAFGYSIDTSNSMSGYLAPEQVVQNKKYSTRNALVDSFGLGMTLYFVLSGRDPIFSQQQHGNWRQTLTELVLTHECKEWRSLPRRFARLIEWTTRDKQIERWDLAQICGELGRLREALSSPSHVESPELLTEEIAARSIMQNQYRWDQDTDAAWMSLPTGVRIAVAADSSRREIICDCKWMDSGIADLKNIGKYMPRVCDQVTATMKDGGWNPLVSKRSQSEVSLKFVISSALAAKRLNHVAESVSKTVDKFEFS